MPAPPWLHILNTQQSSPINGCAVLCRCKNSPATSWAGQSLWQIFLQAASLQAASVRAASLRTASLRAASLRTASLRAASLRAASLRAASLRTASLRAASLRTASLRAASLRAASPRAVSPRAASLWGAYLPASSSHYYTTACLIIPEHALLTHSWARMAISVWLIWAG